MTGFCPYFWDSQAREEQSKQTEYEQQFKKLPQLRPYLFLHLTAPGPDCSKAG